MAVEKKSRTKKRIILYAAFVGVVCTLTYLGWFFTPHLGFDEDRTELFGLFGEQDWEAADELLVEMDERYPEDVRVPLLRAYMEESRGHIEAAKAIYAATVNKAYNDRQRAELLVTVADIERRQGNAEAAERQLADAVKQYGESYRSRHLRVLLLIEKHAFKEALGEAGLMAEENSVDPHARSLRAHIRKLMEASVSGADKAVTVGRSTGTSSVGQGFEDHN